MKIKNKIVSYFVAPPARPGGMPRVFPSPVTMSASVAKSLIIRNLAQKDRFQGDLLQVCFDVDSDIIYTPNADSFTHEQMLPMIQAAQMAITQDYGGFANRPPIGGSPFSSIRVRSITSFNYATKIIKEHHKGKVFTDLPVLEVNLTRMPKTLTTLPDRFQRDTTFYGGYIGPSSGDSITFWDELFLDGRKRPSPIPLMTQRTPFILINISRETEITAYEKEWVVLSGYRDYLYDVKTVEENEKHVSGDIAEFADLYAIKRFLYLGWPLEQVSGFQLSQHQGVTNLDELIKGIYRIMVAVQALVKEGYKDPSQNSYYYTFKIDPNDLPFALEEVFDMQTGKIAVDSQLDHFRVIDYDMSTSNMIIESRVFFSAEVCKSILRAKSEPFITTFNPVFKTIDVKSGQMGLAAIQDKKQVAKIKAVYNYLLQGEVEDPTKVHFKFGEVARGDWAVNPMIYNTRKISDYYYAYDIIMKMCKKYDAPFRDLEVVIGPIERFMGRGSRGGFAGETTFAKHKLTVPYQVDRDVFISPPVILINSRTSPSFAKQTETLIHEYRHYIFEIQNPGYEKKYGDMSSATGDERLKQWYLYFTDPSEGAAHREQIEYELLLGKSVDEIVRDKVEGEVTLNNYEIALKYREMVEEVAMKLEERKEEEPKSMGDNANEEEKPVR